MSPKKKTEDLEEPEEQGPSEKKVERIVSLTSLQFLVDAHLAIKDRRTATQIRQSHLALKDRVDPETDALLERIKGLEAYTRDRLDALMKTHPAYPWFSRVKGVGTESMGQVVGLIDIARARSVSSLWRFTGYHTVGVNEPSETAPEASKRAFQDAKSHWEAGTLPPVGKKSLSDLVKPPHYGTVAEEDYAGWYLFYSEQLQVFGLGAKAPKRIPGYLSDSNMFLRTMVWRLVSSIIKNGARYGGSHFYTLFEEELRKLEEKYKRQGRQIVPALKLPKENGKRFESAEVISLGHVRNQAQRKVAKLFLACLWQVWREAEGLPTGTPYAFGVLGHDERSFIDPWQMVDKPAKRARRIKTSEMKLTKAA